MYAGIHAEGYGAGGNRGSTTDHGVKLREYCAVAVMAILITAPLGAFLIDLTYKKLLMQAKQEF